MPQPPEAMLPASVGSGGRIDLFPKWCGRSRRHRAVCRWLLLSVVGGLGVLGCGHDTTGPAPRDPATLPWALTLNEHAVTLTTTPGANTVQLAATSRTATGTPLSGATVQYTTSDSYSAVVDAHGLVTARNPTNRVLIIATATLANVSVSDTAVVRVNDPSVAGTPPVAPAHLVLQATQNPSSPFLQPVPPTGEPFMVDCEMPDGVTELFSTRYVGLTPHVLTADGTDLTNTVIVDYRSSDPSLLSVAGAAATYRPWPGDLNPICASSQVGTVWITATALVYGTVVQDSVRIQVVPALGTLVMVLQRTPVATGQLVNYFDPGTITIGAGGVVAWVIDRANLAQPQADSIDVVFDAPPGPVQGADTTAFGAFLRNTYPYPFEAAGGNISLFARDTVNWGGDTVGVRTRQFPVPGTYHYHSARYRTTGTVVVLPWPGHGE